MSKEDDIKKEYIGLCGWTWEIDDYLKIPSLDDQFKAAMTEAWVDGKYEALYDEMPFKEDVIRLLDAYIKDKESSVPLERDGGDQDDTKEVRIFLAQLKTRIVRVEKLLSTNP